MSEFSEIGFTSVFQGFFQNGSADVSKIVNILNGNKIQINHLCMFTATEEEVDYQNFSFVVRRPFIETVTSDFPELRKGDISRRSRLQAEKVTISNIYGFASKMKLRTLFTSPAKYRELMMILQPWQIYRDEILSRFDNLPVIDGASSLNDIWSMHILRKGGVIRTVPSDQVASVLEPLSDNQAILMPATVWAVQTYDGQAQQVAIAVWENDIPDLMNSFEDATDDFIAIRARAVEADIERYEGLWVAIERLLSDLGSLDRLCRSVFTCPTDAVPAELLFELI